MLYLELDWQVLYRYKILHLDCQILESDWELL